MLLCANEPLEKLVTERADPIVSPGEVSGHVHTSEYGFSLIVLACAGRAVALAWRVCCFGWKQWPALHWPRVR